MKKYTLASIQLVILVFALGVILSVPLAATVEVDVEIDPNRVDLGAEYPKWFKFKLWVSGKYKNYNVSSIDPKTVLVEGILKPPPGKGLWKAKDNTVTFKIKSEDLINYVIWPKIYHMARVDPNPDKGTQFPYKIDITVTGNFYDGTPFSGADTIHVYVPKDGPPPPPPPLFDSLVKNAAVEKSAEM